MTLGSTGPDARKLARLVKSRKVRRVVVDVRLNPGGDNHTYAPLLAVLRSKAVNRPGRLVVLISRSTFSAAANFITELDRKTKAVFVGETSGGAPNLYGDVAPVDLPVGRRDRGRRGRLLADELRDGSAERDRAGRPGRSQLVGVLPRQGPRARRSPSVSGRTLDSAP